MDIEHFIKARLAQLEAGIQHSQMHINNLDINKLIRRDTEAAYKIMESLNKMEALAAGSDEGPWQLEHINEMWCAIASRWRGHRDFKREWLSQ